MQNKFKTMERKLVLSRLKTPDGTILVSRHVHDFVTHKDAVTGEVYILDGGKDYRRESFNNVPGEDVSIYSDESFDVIREVLERGTFDKDGNRIWKPICELTDSHLKNILEYNKDRGMDDSDFSKYIRMEIKYRQDHMISIPDSEYV